MSKENHLALGIVTHPGLQVLRRFRPEYLLMPPSLQPQLWSWRSLSELTSEARCAAGVGRLLTRLVHTWARAKCPAHSISFNPHQSAEMGMSVPISQMRQMEPREGKQ